VFPILEILKEQQLGIEKLVKNVRKNLHKQNVIENILEQK
jgi:hypothetical protein